MMVAESMIQENRSRLVGELFQGAVYGLGISAAIWTAVPMTNCLKPRTPGSSAIALKSRIA